MQLPKQPVNFCEGTIVSKADGFYSVDTAFGRYDGVPSACGSAEPNDKVTVGFRDPMDRRLPVIFGNASRVVGETTNQTVLATWVVPEGSPRLPQRSGSTQPQLILSGPGAPDVLMTLRRMTAGGDIYDPSRTDFIGLLLFALGPESSPSDVILASMRAIYDTIPPTTGPRVQIKEHALLGTANAEVQVPIAIANLSPYDLSGGIVYLPNRQAGHFFLHQVSGSEVVFTICVDAGIVSFQRGSAFQYPCDWVADPLRYNVRSGSISCAERYLLEGAYNGIVVDPETGLFTSGGARVQLYTRTGYEWAASHLVDFGTFLPAEVMGGANDSTRGIFSTGIVRAEEPTWDEENEQWIYPEGNWALNMLSTRWPFFAYLTRREWWLWINTLAGPMPHFYTVAIDATSGAAEVVDDWTPDLTWRLLYDDLVTHFEAGLNLEACNTLNIVHTPSPSFGPGSFPCGGNMDGRPYSFPGPVGSEVITREVSEGELRTVKYAVYGGVTGKHYTGFVAQPPGIDTDDYRSGERFYAQPFLGPSPYWPVDEPPNLVGTSAQCPSGIITPANLYVHCACEPLHYASGCYLADNVPQSERQFEDPASYELWRTVMASEWWGSLYPVSSNYLWTIDKTAPRSIEDGGDGTGLPPYEVDPTLQLGPDPNDYIGGPPPYGTFDPEVGNAWEVVDTVQWRFYAVKCHGEYSYQTRSRTMVSVYDATTKSLKFRHDISQYLIDGPLNGHASRNPCPQRLPVWSILPAGTDKLWVLRDRHWNTTPNHRGEQIYNGTEPYLELYQINEASLTLLHRLNLHPAADLPGRALGPVYDRQPYMLVGQDSAGRHYATVWTEWSSNHHLISEVLINGETPIKTEAWDSADVPRIPEARNAVHHDGKLFWHDLEAPNRLLSK